MPREPSSPHFAAAVSWALWAPAGPRGRPAPVGRPAAPSTHGGHASHGTACAAAISVGSLISACGPRVCWAARAAEPPADEEQRAKRTKRARRLGRRLGETAGETAG
eukprot:1495441-Prymnesium_polylepis.1